MFWICLVAAVIFLIITVAMFFFFNIPLIFSIRTGRAKKKTIEEMQRANSETGRLRPVGRFSTANLTNSGMLGSTGGIGKTGSVGKTGRFGRGGAMSKKGRIKDLKAAYEAEQAMIAKEQQQANAPANVNAAPVSEPAKPSFTVAKPTASDATELFSAQTTEPAAPTAPISTPAKPTPAKPTVTTPTVASPTVAPTPTTVPAGTFPMMQTPEATELLGGTQVPMAGANYEFAETNILSESQPTFQETSLLSADGMGGGFRSEFVVLQKIVHIHSNEVVT